MATDHFATKLSVLMKEWDYCQTHIGRFDTIIFGIRGWAVSAFTAILAVAATQRLPFLVIFATFPVVMFWLIDAVNRLIQRRFLTRAIEIEAYFRSDAFRRDIENCAFQDFESPIGFTSYINNMSDREQLLAVLREANRNSVRVVYIPMLVLCFACYPLLKAWGP